MRKTSQRETIFEILSHSPCALSPDELLAECQKTLPSMGIATIHRELKRLRAEHLLEEVQVAGDLLRFCISKKHHHHHFKCSSCGKVFDVACNHPQISVPQGFALKSYELNLFGTCKTCVA